MHVELGGGAASITSALKVPDLLEKLPEVTKATFRNSGEALLR